MQSRRWGKGPEMTGLSTSSVAVNTVDEADAVLLAEAGGPHPFSVGLTRSNAERVMANYLAMSVAFPYLQAGAGLPIIQRCIDENRDVESDVELTAVVGAFLTWD